MRRNKGKPAISLVYDGSDGGKDFARHHDDRQKVMPGKARRQGKCASRASPKLPSWPVTIGYYLFEEDNAETPLYQINFDMYENGVSTGLVLDYGVFALWGKLADLDLLKAETCK